MLEQTTVAVEADSGEINALLAAADVGSCPPELATFIRKLEQRVEEIEADYDVYRAAVDTVNRIAAHYALPMREPTSDPDDEQEH